jgi:hypothetical protein
MRTFVGGRAAWTPFDLGEPVTVSAHPGLPVSGYSPQSQDNVDLVNENKAIEEQVLRMLDEMAKDTDRFDQRWLAIGRTHIEQGWMAINRAVFQPKRVDL